ncbi:MAG TPA: FHA domain-containing protein, partial [Phycisphaerales bacterium]|nr:FHA domain-containing protein [Phycisphaerales bacterium]
MACLIVTNGAQQGDFYPLGYRTNVVGRAEALPIQILDDLVSRKHLQVRYDAGTQKYHALDMRSRHGVLINGRRISDEVALAEGDHIQIGRTLLLFTEEEINDRQSALGH